MPSPNLQFVAFRADGFSVSGQHDPATAPVAPELLETYQRRTQHWLDTVMSRPGAFNGHRAVLQAYELSENSLKLQTAYRTYVEGRGLADAWRERPAEFAENQNLAEVVAGASWGMSLVTFIRLPDNYVLCGQRSLSLLVNPGAWSVGFTEMMEPTDIHPDTMQPLLDRLVQEELPSLAGLGTHRFVGLGVRDQTYGWQLASVLDLSGVPAEQLKQALAMLQPDAETVAWGVCTLAAPTTMPAWLPTNLQSEQSKTPDDFENARMVLERIDSAVSVPKMSSRIGVDIWTYLR